MSKNGNWAMEHLGIIILVVVILIIGIIIIYAAGQAMFGGWDQVETSTGGLAP